MFTSNRGLLLILLIAFVVVVSCLTLAYAQGGEAQDAQISKNANDIATLRTEFDERLNALEENASTDETPAEPPASGHPPVYLFADNAALGMNDGLAATVSGPFNLCLSADDGVEDRVEFDWGVGQHDEGASLYCAAGSDDGLSENLSLAPGVYEFAIWSPNVERFVVTLTVQGAPPIPEPPNPQATTKAAQYGAWKPTPENQDYPCINILNCFWAGWSADRYTTQQLFDLGYLDAKTGLPVKQIPSGDYYHGNGAAFFTLDPKNHEGKWVLDWKCVAGTDCVDPKLMFFNGDGELKRIGNRIEFERTNAQWHEQIRLERVRNGGLKELRLYRAEHEAAINAGAVGNPQFIAELSKYGTLRTMDLQSINRMDARSIDRVATMDAAHWGNSLNQNVDFQVNYPHQSMPFEATFKLAMEADVELWVHWPINIGAPEDLYTKTNEQIQAMARDNAQAIIDSPQWDLFARAWVKALIDSGYPATRAVKLSLCNEVWNFGNAFFVTCIMYADGIGNVLTGGEPYSYRAGYGRLIARMIDAVEKELKRVRRDQNIVYVMETQTGNTGVARQAFERMVAHSDWDKVKDKVGVGLTNYWGGDCTDKECVLNGPATTVGTRAWVVKAWRDEVAVAAEFGVTKILAYEGGPHAVRWAKENPDTHWGDDGAEVNIAINEALLAEFPDAELANYAGNGDRGQPWFDRSNYDKTNPMYKSWEAYQKGGIQ